MITARLIFCLSYSIDILILCLKKSKLPCQKELNFRILIAKKERDTQCMYDECPSYERLTEKVVFEQSPNSHPGPLKTTVS